MRTGDVRGGADVHPLVYVRGRRLSAVGRRSRPGPACTIEGMSSSFASSRVSAVVVGALVGAAAGILLITAAGTFSITVGGVFAGVALGVPVLAGAVVGVVMTPGNTRSNPG